MTVASEFKLRVLVSNSKDAAEYAKNTWFSRNDHSLILEFEDSNGQLDIYLKAVGRFTAYSKEGKYSVSDVIKTFATDRSEKLVVLLNPPNGQVLSDAVHLCQENSLRVLCHFTSVNRCFTPLLPSIITECTYDFGPSYLSKRYFKVDNELLHIGSIPKLRGIFVINSNASQNVEQFVGLNFMNYHDLAPLNDMAGMCCLSLGTAIPFVPGGPLEKNGTKFMGRFLKYDPEKCPDLLIPGCMHIFMDMKPDAVRELCARVLNNETLLKESLFLCIAQTEPACVFANLANQFQLTDFVILPNIQARRVSLLETSVAKAEPELILQTNETKESKADRTLFTVGERTIVLEREPLLLFHNPDTLAKDECLTLDEGFPVEAQYSLFYNDQHMCDSTVHDGQAVFVLPTTCEPGWLRVSMKNETEEQHICWNGQFYFSRYVVHSIKRSFTLTPRAKYRATLSSDTVMLRTSLENEFQLVDRAKPLFEAWSSKGKFVRLACLQTVTEQILKGIRDAKSDRSVLITFSKNANTHFYPKKMEMTEVYIDRPHSA